MLAVSRAAGGLQSVRGQHCGDDNIITPDASRYNILAPSVLAVSWAVATIGGIYRGMAYEENE